MFLREYNVLATASSVEELRKKLSKPQLEQYGDAFIPEFVYSVIRRLPRFSSMRVSSNQTFYMKRQLMVFQRGHQEDAEEFLGFLLDGLHEEAASALRQAGTASSGVSSPSDHLSVANGRSEAEETAIGSVGDGWLEVGPKQRSAVTRLSGSISIESPITKIFGGTLRSELRVPGLKISVTYEPYQPLQLDIGSPQVRNITDALKGLTRPEVIHGEFNSPRGPGIMATKQVFIENLPPVLILHLKRFQYDNTGGAQKIWKKVGYPIELEIPREVLSSTKRAAKGSLPKYRLTGVIYHHGKSASGGHYTVDLLRQDGVEWIRLDDTVIRRVRSEDIAAEAVLEEDSQKGRGESEDSHRRDGRNEDDGQSGWKQVNGGENRSSGNWAKALNGSATHTAVSVNDSAKTKAHLSSLSKDRVAYLLFYSRI
jgi:ubiquitin carboxyl-terminal hydrolase 10